jgi:hypothetical protein
VFPRQRFECGHSVRIDVAEVEVSQPLRLDLEHAARGPAQLVDLGAGETVDVRPVAGHHDEQPQIVGDQTGLGV